MSVWSCDKCGKLASLDDILGGQCGCDRSSRWGFWEGVGTYRYNDEARKSWQERYCEDYTAKLENERLQAHAPATYSFVSSITEWEVANREAAGVYDDTTEAYPI